MIKLWNIITVHPCDHNIHLNGSKTRELIVKFVKLLEFSCFQGKKIMVIVRYGAVWICVHICVSGFFLSTFAFQAFFFSAANVDFQP